MRRLARELGVDLASVKGTGRKGRITKEDVKAAKDAPPAAAGGAGGHSRAWTWRRGRRSTSRSTARSSASRCRAIKKISGPALSRNWVMIPHVTHDDEADITDLEAFRKQINAEQRT